MEAVISANYTPVPGVYTRKEGQKNEGKNILSMLVKTILQPDPEERPSLDAILGLSILKKYVKRECKFLAKNGITEELSGGNGGKVKGKGGGGGGGGGGGVDAQAAASGAAPAPPPPAPPRGDSDKKLRRGNFRRKVGFERS